MHVVTHYLENLGNQTSYLPHTQSFTIKKNNLQRLVPCLRKVIHHIQYLVCFGFFFCFVFYSYVILACRQELFSKLHLLVHSSTLRHLRTERTFNRWSNQIYLSASLFAFSLCAVRVSLNAAARRDLKRFLPYSQL